MAVNIPSMQEMLEAGVHFGHKVSRGNPKMSVFIYGARDGIHIIDLAKSEAKLREAAEFVNNLGKEDKVLVVIGTKKQAREIAEATAKSLGIHYLTSHWVGGLLTNFDEISKNIRKLIELKKEKEAGTLSRYTKKEQLLLTRKLEKFDRELGGVATLTKVPDALFVLDTVADSTAVKEALKMGIKIVGVSDTNANPAELDYPIPANDDGIKSIKIICETILNAYAAGKKSAQPTATEEIQPVADKKEKKTAEKSTPEDSQAEEAAPIISEEVAAAEEQIEQKVLEEQERKVE